MQSSVGLWHMTVLPPLFMGCSGTDPRAQVQTWHAKLRHGQRIESWNSPHGSVTDLLEALLLRSSSMLGMSAFSSYNSVMIGLQGTPLLHAC